MAMSSGVQAIHSNVFTSWMSEWWSSPWSSPSAVTRVMAAVAVIAGAGELGGRLTERGALVQPQQVAGGQHGAEGGDDGEHAEQRRR